MTDVRYSPTNGAWPDEVPPHILVVDDDERILSLLGRYLGEQGFLVSVAADAVTARELMRTLSFDLLVVDVMMPGEDGLSLTAAVREASSVPVLMLTAMGESADRIKGLESGADDYLPKPFDPRELLLRIRSILRRVRSSPQGGGSRDSSLLALGPCRFDVTREVLSGPDGPIHLTTAELSLLRVFAERVGEAVEREELATLTGAEGGPRTIDVQVTRLRKKIEGDSRTPRYLRTVRGKGYQLVPD